MEHDVKFTIEKISDNFFRFVFETTAITKLKTYNYFFLTKEQMKLLANKINSNLNDKPKKS